MPHAQALHRIMATRSCFRARPASRRGTAHQMGNRPNGHHHGRGNHLRNYVWFHGSLGRWPAHGFAYCRVGNRCFCILIRSPKCRQSGVQFWHRKNQFAGRFYRSHLIVGVRPVDGLGKCRTVLESGWNRIQFSNLCSHNRVAGKRCERIPFEHRR